MGVKHFLYRLIGGLGLGVMLLACSLSRYSAEMVDTPSQAAPAGAPAAPTARTEAVVNPPAPAGKTPAPVAGASAERVQVVYVKDNDLWLWAGGQARRITFLGPVFSPQISPDGSLVAFLRPADEFHIELWAVNVDGGNERRLVSIADLDAIGSAARDPNALAITPYRFAWLQDGHRLAFNTQQVFNGPGQSLLEDLHWVEADSGQIKTLFPPGQGGEFVFSPDGGQVILSRPDQLLLARLGSGETLRLMDYTPVVTYSEYHYYAAPVWSPDGQFLRVAIPPADPLATPPQPTTLWKLALDGQPQPEGTVTTVPFQEIPLAYAPNLGRIAFLRTAGQLDENQRELHLATFDGQGDFVYAKGPLLRFLGWSPDSQRLAYLVGEMQELWLGAIDGTPQAYHAAQFGVSDLTWLTAKQFLLVQQRDQVYTLLLADVDGEAVEVATFTGQAPVYAAGR